MENVDTVLIIWLYVWAGFKFFEDHDLSIVEKFWAILGWPVGIIVVSVVNGIKFFTRKP